MEQVSEKKFPLNAESYKLYEEVGEGVSATVHRALCIPLNEIVAIKVLDLEKCNNDLTKISGTEIYLCPRHNIEIYGELSKPHPRKQAMEQEKHYLILNDGETSLQTKISGTEIYLCPRHNIEIYGELSKPHPRKQAMEQEKHYLILNDGETSLQTKISGTEIYLCPRHNIEIYGELSKPHPRKQAMEQEKHYLILNDGETSLQDGIRREVQMMSLIDHPNLLRAYCSFTAGQNLWVVMPYMAGGSCLHIMKSAYPDGFEEPVISTLLREVLKALVYLHAHGHIHRDVKAGNILIDSNGAVKLADFGVSACMFDTGDRQRSRNTFVGTPCWMAPEVMQQLHGYDFKADIWSFGITALELAHGHAPFSKYPPMKVLLMTLQNAPPGLDYERDKRFSKSFKEMVAACLVKDPKKRPSSDKLFKHHFFKQARSYDYLARTILDGLKPLGDRFRMLKAKEADFLVQNKALYGDKDQLSQQEYIRGISAWNFNLEDLKNQAALIQDYDGATNTEDLNLSVKQRDNHDDVGYPAERLSPEKANQSDAAPQLDDGLNNIHDLESSLAAFPIQPLKALKGCFDVCADDVGTGSPSWKNASQLHSSPKDEDQETGTDDGENLGQSCSMPSAVVPCRKKTVKALMHDSVLYPKRVGGDGDREFVQPRYPSDRNYSGPLPYRQKKDINNHSSAEDTSEGAVVQRKGRFKVTSAELSPKGPTNCFFNPISEGSASPTTLTLSAAAVLPSLQCILQQNNMQREEILRLIKYAEQTSGNSMELSEVGTNELSLIPSASTRERELHSQMIQLQQSIGSLVEELQRQKMKNAQLEKKLNTLVKKEEKIRE